MVLPGFFFVTTRITQLVFLIPIIGMLSYFVHGFVEANYLTPSFVLVLFIVSVLAGVWALATLFFYASAKHNGYLLAFVDTGIFAGLIAGVYELRQIANADCSNFNVRSPIALQLGVFNYELPKACNLLKASFALAIMEIIFFFWSAILGLWIHHHHRKDRGHGGSRRTEEKHYSRHGHRHGGSRSRSRGGAASDYYSGNRGGRGSSVGRSRRASRSNYDGGRRAYV